MARLTLSCNAQKFLILQRGFYPMLRNMLRNMRCNMRCNMLRNMRCNMLRNMSEIT